MRKLVFTRHIVPAVGMLFISLTSTLCEGQTVSTNLVAGWVGKPGIAGATVFICEAKSGIPLDSATHQEMTASFSGGFLCVKSDESGRFSFTNVPSGTYRLIAEFWPGMDTNGPSKGAINIPPAAKVQLLGSAEDVAVPSEAATNVNIRPLGTGTITLDQQFYNDAGYVLVSTKPTSGDPILGFLGWNEAFLSHVIGVGCIAKGQTFTMSGLPDRDVEVAIFANDNSPGFGGTNYSTLPTTPQKLPIIAGWSDAQHEPPARIRHILEILRANHTDVGELLHLKKAPRPANYNEFLRELKSQLGPLDRTIKLPNGEEATVADVFAATAYARLLKNEEKRTGKE